YCLSHTEFTVLEKKFLTPGNREVLRENTYSGHRFIAGIYSENRHFAIYYFRFNCSENLSSARTIFAQGNLWKSSSYCRKLWQNRSGNISSQSSCTHRSRIGHRSGS